jgi:hypothetical protein
MRRVPMVLLVCLALTLVSTLALGEGAKEKAGSAKSAMQMFLIESPHSAEECMAVMDEVSKNKSLTAWDWGCMSGNHTAYRMVKAKDEAAALAMVPENVRAKAHAYQIGKMTPAMLATAHKEHM